MKRLKTTNKISIIIILVFIIGTIIAYNVIYTPEYSSLEQAVEKSSKGGKIGIKYNYDKGSFVFIENSIFKQYDYYYVRNKKWYNKGYVYKKEYLINNQYEIYVYYVPKNDLTFIQVTTSEELGNLNDSLSTMFQELKVKGDNKVYFAGLSKKLPEDYKISINDQEYLLNEYGKDFKLFQ